MAKAAQDAGTASRQMLEAATVLSSEAQNLRQGVDGFVASVRTG